MLFLVSVDARPTETVEDFTFIEGAVVNVWVRAASDLEAKSRAAREIEMAGWLQDTEASVRQVTLDDYRDDHPGRKYFDQAMIDGIVLVFHTWLTDSDHVH